MRPDALSRRWTAARGASSITLLEVRHYVATAMLDAGESYRTVADILGNSEATLRLHYDGGQESRSERQYRPWSFEALACNRERGAAAGGVLAGFAFRGEDHPAADARDAPGKTPSCRCVQCSLNTAAVVAPK